MSVVSVAMGCALGSNTPAQDLTYAAWKTCETEGRIPPEVRLTRVAPDGRYWIVYDRAGSFVVGDVPGCINEQFARQGQPSPAMSAEPVPYPRWPPEHERIW